MSVAGTPSHYPQRHTKPYSLSTPAQSLPDHYPPRLRNPRQSRLGSRQRAPRLCSGLGQQKLVCASTCRITKSMPSSPHTPSIVSGSRSITMCLVQRCLFSIIGQHGSRPPGMRTYSVKVRYNFRLVASIVVVVKRQFLRRQFRHYIWQLKKNSLFPSRTHNGH
jgi:hypothetical protein